MSDLISELQNIDDNDPHDDPNSLINNICISDAATGNIIFERVYKWKETAAFSNLGSLIQVFYQFAREVDEGVISSINFESGSNSSTKKKRNDILQPDKDTMQMVTLKTKDIIVSVFYDMVGSMVPSSGDSLKLNVLLHSVKTLFERKFLTELMENRGKFHDSSVSESQPITNSSFMSNENDSSHTLKSFESFNSIADKLKSQIFLETTDGLDEGDPLHDPVPVRSQQERKRGGQSRPRTLDEHVQQQIASIDIHMGHQLTLPDHDTGGAGASVAPSTGSLSPTSTGMEGMH